MTSKFKCRVSSYFIFTLIIKLKHMEELVCDFDHFALGRESWSMCFSCICLFILHELISVFLLFLLAVFGKNEATIVIAVLFEMVKNILN